jgi:hypothetical protein
MKCQKHYLIQQETVLYEIIGKGNINPCKCVHMRDGTVVTARNITALREVSLALENGGRKMGLRLNEKKTKNHTYPNARRL